MSKYPSGELSIDRKDRAKVPSAGLRYRSADERVCDFDPVLLPMTPEEAMLEAARCVHCPDPAPCTIACPVHNDIPSALWLIEQGRFLEAAELYRETSSLPSICGRVCPHEELCQRSCSHSKSNDPVQTGALEAFVVDYQRLQGKVHIPVGEPTGKKIAIIGSGPSGLACADILVQKGHAVTIFESKNAPGGLLLFGIPNFKLPKDVVSERVLDLMEAGVKFEYNTYIGKDKTIDDLFTAGYEAVFIGVGSQVDAPLKAPGVDLPGVYNATDFLARANFDLETLPEKLCVSMIVDRLAEEMSSMPEIGRNVVVIGGGDTASDCLRVSLRLDTDSVTCLYRRTENEMPGSKKDRQLAKEEGAQYQFLTQPIAFHAGADGRLEKVECIRMELGEPDESGRRRPVPVEDSNFFVEADTAIMALGYWPDETIGKSTPNLETHDWGLITADPTTGSTSRPGVFAGGDAVTGPDLVVTAQAAGRRAAESIHTYLMK
ncbi:MAG: NAD(P)-dependent oxidoreductase [Anaerolineales bacterium]|nr:NAD(P)-dependent oxidoreductase [Anaerolineales bacterium]